MLFRSPKPQTPNPKPQTPNPVSIVEMPVILYMRSAARLALKGEGTMNGRPHTCGLCVDSKTSKNNSKHVHHANNMHSNRQGYQNQESRRTNVVSNYSLNAPDLTQSQQLASVNSACDHGCKCQCHSLHETDRLKSSTRGGDRERSFEAYSKLPPHAISLAAPHGSTYLSQSYVSPPVASEYTESFIPPWKSKHSTRQEGVSARLYEDALSREMDSRRESLPTREKSLYPITSQGYAIDRHTNTTFNRYEAIPESVRFNKSRYHILQDNNRIYHVYDMGVKTPYK